MTYTQKHETDVKEAIALEQTAIAALNHDLHETVKQIGEAHQAQLDILGIAEQDLDYAEALILYLDKKLTWVIRQPGISPAHRNASIDSSCQQARVLLNQSAARHPRIIARLESVRNRCATLSKEHAIPMGSPAALPQKRTP